MNCLGEDRTSPPEIKAVPEPEFQLQTPALSPQQGPPRAAAGWDGMDEDGWDESG